MTINISGFYINVLEIPITILLIFIVLNDLWIRGTRLSMEHKNAFQFYCALSSSYLIIILISSLSASNLSLVVKSFFKWLEIFAISGLVFLFVARQSRFKFIYWVIFVSTFLTLLFLIFEIVKGNYRIVIDRILPAYDFFFALLLIVPFAFYHKYKATILVAALLFLSAILSLSRGIWLGLFILFLYLFQYLKKKSIIKYLGLAFIVIIITIGAFKPVRILFTNRIDEIMMMRNVSNIERSSLIRYALIGFSSSPVWGVGSLNFPLFLREEGLTQGLVAKDITILEPHNFFLQTLTEEGVLGFLIIIMFFANVYIILFKNNRLFSVNGSDINLYLLGMRSLFIGIMINLSLGFVANEFRFNLALFLGLALALTKKNICIDVRGTSNKQNLLLWNL